MHIRKAGVVLRTNSLAAEQAGRDLLAWFAARGVDAQIDVIHPEMDVLVILGGDGTLLHVADQASHHGIPVVGVNLGDLGFLTEVAAEDCFTAMEALLAGRVVVEDRMMLKARLRSVSGETPWQYALNDVVISKEIVDRLVRLSTWANDEYITTYKADGVIFSTPTGSTAYNLSAGGPIAHPGLRSILVTPICPFMLESRPILLPAGMVLSTRLAGSEHDVKVIVDGRFAWDMEENDLLEVQAAEQPLRLISSPRKGYFEILRSKLNWGGSSGCPPLSPGCKDNS